MKNKYTIACILLVVFVLGLVAPALASAELETVKADAYICLLYTSDAADE